EHGVVHRDLKPSNILIDANGVAVVTDFGLARPERDVEGLTADGDLLGTPTYMAPEQAAGDVQHIDARSDIYSLRVGLYPMLTRRVPCDGPPLAVLTKIRDEPVPAPTRFRPDLDLALEALILRALARAQPERFQGAGEILQALEEWLAQEASRRGAAT